MLKRTEAVGIGSTLGGNPITRKLSGCRMSGPVNETSPLLSVTRVDDSNVVNGTGAIELLALISVANNSATTITPAIAGVMVAL